MSKLFVIKEYDIYPQGIVVFPKEEISIQGLESLISINGHAIRILMYQPGE
jgi:hypothetical protein